MYKIYKITSPSGKVYIGLTKNIKNRFSSYKNLKCKSQQILYKSLIKYGWDLHTKEIIYEFDTIEEAEIAEIREILFYKLNKISLNIAFGGIGGVSKGKDNPNSKIVYQYSMDGKLIKKWDSLSDIKREIGISVAEISIACRKKTFYSKGYFWCFEKDKEIISFNRKIGKNGKSVLKIDKNLNIIEKFNSAIEAAKGNKKDYCGIIDCLYLKYRTYLGFFWVKEENFSKNFIENLNKLPERKVAKRPVKIFRIKDGKKEIFNSITEAFLFTRVTTLTIQRHLKGKNKSKKQEWFYEK